MQQAITQAEYDEWKMISQAEAEVLTRVPPGQRTAVFQLVHEYRSSVIFLLDLIELFDSSPRRSVPGNGSSAEGLGMSRSMVAKKIKKLGLEVSDFRFDNVMLIDLVEKSPILKKLRKQVLDLVKKMTA